MSVKDAVVNRFQSICKERNIKINELANLSGVTPSTVYSMMDSNIYTAEPEELSAQWGFVWSTDPAKALPFIALSTSPYNEGECCTENGAVYRSNMSGNVWAPSAYPSGWNKVEV